MSVQQVKARIVKATGRLALAKMEICMKLVYSVLAALFFSLLVSSQCFSEDNQADTRFTLSENGVVQDHVSKLMWAASDNGADINWHDSEAYCQNFDLGGYSDWRLPTLEELAALYDSAKKESGKFGITPKIKLTSCCVWSADESMRSSAIFSFRTGNKPWGFQADTRELRVLPVRDDRSLTIKHNR